MSEWVVGPLLQPASAPHNALHVESHNATLYLRSAVELQLFSDLSPGDGDSLR